MRIVLTLLTAISLSTLACSEAKKATRRERRSLSQADYNQLKALNTLLKDNEDAMSTAFRPKAMASEKAREMAKTIEESGCRATRNELPSENFKANWTATQQIEGPDTCPIYNQRYWEFRLRPDSSELWMRHIFSTKPAHKEFLKQTGIKFLSAAVGRFFVTHDPRTGVTKIQGGMKYEAFELANGVRLQAEIRTNQNYSGDRGRGSVTVTITQPGVFSHSGGITWDARDFASRRYFAEDGDIDRDKFLEMFSFFRMDEFVDNSDRMR